MFGFYYSPNICSALPLFTIGVIECPCPDCGEDDKGLEIAVGWLWWGFIVFIPFSNE